MNATLKLPPGQSPEYETGLGLRRQQWLEAMKEYMSLYCDSKGRQEDNLTPAQRRGIEKLQKRIQTGEIVVCCTDKSGKLAVMPMELYESAGAVHVSKDKAKEVKLK